MSDLELDDNGDIFVENGDLSMTMGVDAIAQCVSQRLKTFLGEYFLDSREGIPWIQQILKKGADPVIIDSVIKRTIVQSPGVLQITEFSLLIDRSTRELQIQFKADSVDGEIEFSEVYS